MKEIKTKAILSIGDVKIEIGLYDTSLAREIADKLPLCTVMEEFGGREYCGEELPFVPENMQENQTYFDVGDFVYWGKGNALAFFYAEGESKAVPSGVAVIGKILSDLTELKIMPTQIKVTLSKQ